MKICVVHNHPIEYKHLLFQAMKQEGLNFDVLFLASRSSIRYEPIPLSQDFYHYRIAVDHPFEGIPVLPSISQVWKHLSELNPDIVIIGGYHAIGLWTAWTWARTHGRPIILWIESNEFDHPRMWAKELPKKLYISACARAHVYSGSNKAYLMKLGMSASKIDIKRAVVDLSRFPPIADRSYSPQDARQLLFVGRLSPEKNLPFLLSAIAAANQQLGKRSIALTIAGAGPMDAELKALTSQLGISGNVKFLGWCPQASLSSVYRQADFLVLPSTSESFGLVALEAMLCGVPVLVSTQCGCATDVVTADTGFRFSPWTAAELVDLLIKLPEISDTRLREMGTAARTLASEYSASSCALRVANSIRSLLASSDSPIHPQSMVSNS